MRGRIGVVSLMVAAGVSLTATWVHADEECIKGFRSPTSGEQAAMRAVLDKGLRALPREISGWTPYTDGDLNVSSQCKDHEPEPWSFEFSRTFDRVDDRAQRDSALKKAGTQYQAARKDNQQTTDAIMARIQELSQAAVAAAQAGDYDKVDALNAEIEKASSQLEALMSGAQGDLDAATEESNRDRSIRIAVEINPGYESLGYEHRAVPAPAGATSAHRWQDTNIGPGDETELVLIGSWRKAEDTYDQVPRAGVAQAVPQGIAVRVTADANRIDSVLGAIDFKALAALVAR